MPIAVDRNLRNQQVASAAVDLIAEGGLDAVTFRNLAAKLACSTTAISHYFKTRNDVLLATYSYIADKRQEQRKHLFESKKLNLVDVLCGILPINEEKRRDWKVWICFWTLGLVDENMAVLQRNRNNATKDEIRNLLLSAGYCNVDPDVLSSEIMTAIYGIAVQSIFDPHGWDQVRQRQALERVIDLHCAHAA